jgi:glutathione transport system permease protein
MLRFIGRRVAFSLLVLVFIVYAVFLAMDMARNSEVSEPDFYLVPYSQAAWASTQQFFRNLVQGDFGSYQTDRGLVPVREILGQSYVNSMGLLLVSLAAAAVLGLLLGITAALRKKASLALLTLTVIGISAPSFFVALLLQRAVIGYTQRFGQALSVAGFGWDFQHMLLPVLVLAARPLAYLTRSAFISLSGTMEEDYIRTARAKGLRSYTIVNIHAMRNILVPVLTAIGVSLRFSLGTLPVVEFFFAWPGMGYQLLNAINNRQAEVVVALAFVMGLTFLLVNLLLDVLYRLVDPRIRESE